MANRLKMTVAQSILSLHAQRWSQHRIADTLEIDRGTVARHIRRAALAAQPDPAGISNAANAPIDPARVAAADSKAAIAPTGSATAAQPVSTVPAAIGVGSAGRQSDAEPWRESILAGHAQGLSAKRIHQDLVAELGASGISYDSVRRLLKRLGAVRPLPMRRMECEPGQEAQVDFGSGARIKTPEGKRRKTHVLRVVLSHSRKAYSEACFRQTAEDFLRVLENAFWHFGGVPKTVVVDNLKAAVLRPDWFDPDLNPKLQSFAQHYGTVILPTKPRMPRHKGKVERGVGYVQDNGLKARVRVAGGRESTSGALGTEHRRYADSRHHQAACGQGVSRSRAGGALTVARRAVPLLPRGPADRQPRRSHRSRQSLLLRAAGVSGPHGLGALGRTAGAGLQSSFRADRLACSPRRASSAP